MALQGLKIKQYIESDDISEILVVKDELKYYDKEEDYYLELFESLVKEKIILTENFEENNWILLNNLEKYEHNIHFPFNNKNISDILKYYLLVKIGLQNSSIKNALRAISSIKLFMEKSNNFDKDYLIKMRDEIKFWADTKKQQIYFIKEFLKFSGLENSNEYFNILDNISIPKTNTRNLPTYQSIITLDYIISDFINVCSNEQLLKYYPVLIWWQLTKIIPMRPLEFFILDKNCLLEKNNKYYIKIDRVKNKNGQVKYKSIPVLKEIEIDESLYVFIKKYVDYIQSINNNDSKYLFSYEVISSFYPKMQPTKRKKRDFISSGFMSTIYKNFCKEVICDYYGFNLIEKGDKEILENKDLERIQYGDTRHIAFCNMMLQGFNPLTIAQIGGHHTLSEQMGYYNHLDTYVSAKTYVMARALKNKLYLKNTNLEITDNNKKSLLKKNIFGLKFYSLPEVENGDGRCSSENFPFDCVCDSCLFCEHFIESKNISQTKLKEQEIIINKEIDNKLKYIKEIIDITVNASESLLKTESKALNTLMNRKTLIDVYKLNSNLNEGDNNNE